MDYQDKWTRWHHKPTDGIEPSSNNGIALAIFGYITVFELRESHWNICNLPEYEQKPLTFKTFIKAVKALYNVKKDIKKKGLTGSRARNYVWENKILDAYPLAFTLPPEDRFFIKKVQNEKTNIFELIYFFLAAFFTIIKDDKSGMMYLLLQIMCIYPNLVKYLPKEKIVSRYYGPDHPFTKNLKKEEK